MNKKRILAVDDHEAILRVYKRALTPLAEVITAGNGQEAIDLLLENVQSGQPKYDLVLTDDNMPIKSGIELLTAIQAYDCPKLMLSTPINISYRGLHELVRGVGGLGVYEKPIEAELYQKIVPELLAERRSETLDQYFRKQLQRSRVVDF